ncbi:unnamed protein product [Bursaphelenchus okinawaensis]|uniref:Small ribosomal subunit protein uS10 domain-containing protein n=1 Tax=Bursaphelenchus okinawaensis TaxID=465554 RepID=A0A811KDT1_9BILA|nr:unnamed protein product [Bursaphelenchus okinawaensis]CAG9101266.1 unnamed protein product [Bursaphelenchus okinawaensis]
MLARLSRFSKNLTQVRNINAATPPPSPASSEGLYEPLIEDKRKYPTYEQVNIRLQGFDYASLERYQRFIHTMAKNFQFKVDESYAVSSTSERITTLKPNSTIVDSELELHTYDRWLRMSSVSAVRLQLFINFVQAHLPSGVKLTAKVHEKADENYRYIPDLLLKSRQDELKSLDDPQVRRNLGWE